MYPPMLETTYAELKDSNMGISGGSPSHRKMIKMLKF